MFKKIFPWIIRIIYLGIVVFVSYYILGFLTISRNEKFLNDNEHRFIEDPNYFISSIALTNFNEKVYAISEKDPLFYYADSTNPKRNEVVVYAFTFFNEDKVSNGLFFFLSGISTNSSGDFKKIKIQLHLDSNIETFDEPIVSTAMYGNTHGLYLLEDELRKNTGDYATIQSIEIDSDSGVPVITIDNGLDEKFNLSRDRYNLVEKYNITDFNNIEETDKIYYNSNMLRELRSYNYIIVLYFMLFFLLILILTYFLFVHSPLMRYFRVKRLKVIAEELGDKEKNNLNKDIDIQRKDIS